MSMADFNQQVITEFRENRGLVGGMFQGAPLLLLHHVGAKSGAERVTPLVYLVDEERYVIFASKAGSPENPAWFHNLMAHPQTEIEVASERVRVVASLATPDERQRLFDAQVQAMPQFAEYQAKTKRQIPVVLLTPVG